MNKKIFSIYSLTLLVLVSIGFLVPTSVNAFSVKQLTNVPVEKDFAVGPGKLELRLAPGETTTKTIRVTNRLGREMNFKIEKEDFEGAQKENTFINLLGDKEGPYSLRNYLQPEVNDFTLKHGERAKIKIRISVPEDTNPGGLYGSTLIRTNPTEDQQISQGARLISRIGILFFVEIEGNAKPNGFVTKFDTVDQQRLFTSPPVNFNFSFHNKGNVHLVPNGKLEIKNLSGSKVGEIEVADLFVMPNTVRKQDLSWEKDFALGRYTANLTLNKGYNDETVTKTTTFWVIPVKFMLITSGAVLLIILIIWYLKSNYQLKRK